MKIFILHCIWENIFKEKQELQLFIEKFWLSLPLVSLWCISWFFGEISQEGFSKILPILNGLSGKYFFYSSLQTDIHENYILWKNILDFEYDEKEIQKNSQAIEQMKKDLESGLLITNSKKWEMSDIILSWVYNIWGFLVKTYFMMSEMIANKNDLQQIIDNPNGLAQYKQQALLLDSIAFDKLDVIKVRFDSVNLQLSSFSEILFKYFKNYVK